MRCRPSGRQRREQRRRRRPSRPTLLNERRRLLRAPLRSPLVGLLPRERSNEPAAAMSLQVARCWLLAAAADDGRGEREREREGQPPAASELTESRLPPAVAAAAARKATGVPSRRPPLQQLCVLLTLAASVLHAAVGGEGAEPSTGDSSRGSAGRAEAVEPPPPMSPYTRRRGKNPGSASKCYRSSISKLSEC